MIYDTVCTKQNLPTALTRTVYRERDRMARDFALTRAKLSLPNSSLHNSDLGSTEAIQALSRLATRLSTRQGLPKSLVCNSL